VLLQYVFLRIFGRMERLNAADVSAMLAFVSELNDLDDPIAFPPRVLVGLRRLIPASEIGYSDSPDVGLSATPTKSRVFIFTRKGGRDFDDRDKLILELLQPHLEARAAAAASAAVASVSLATVEEPAKHETRVERLTAREREILDRVARGQANAEIAFDLGIATATVAKHLEHVYEKLGVASRMAAAVLVSA
jgi:DNA-binding CsgD family transcriptional regulator